ncbi:MAG: hypothetical protein IJT94_09130 [Oscillibacter sp.]|nr:hypothetical protein [Oscillibacter sp.]
MGENRQAKDIWTVFASSTVEFKSARERLGNYIRRLDERVERYGYRCRAVLCEDLSPAMEREGSQAVIDSKIRECQFFHMLIGRKLGEYTEHEFDVAHAQFSEHDLPKIYTWIRKPKGRQPTMPEGSVEQFKLRLRRLEHFWTEYNSLEDLEGRIAVELFVYAVEHSAPKDVERNVRRTHEDRGERIDTPAWDAGAGRYMPLISANAQLARQLRAAADEAESAPGGYDSPGEYDESDGYMDMDGTQEEIEVERHGG